MKALIIYHSEHHGNTRKIADEISKVLNADMLTSNEALKLRPESIEQYDMICFGSGIYYGRFHENIHRFVDGLPYQNGRNCFVFSTTGSKSYSARAHKLIIEKLKEKGFNVIGEFSCLGYDTALSSKGINPGKPDSKDLQEARRAVSKLLK